MVTKPKTIFSQQYFSLSRFVRFTTVDEAERAIALCSGKYVGNTRIVVMAAKESRELFASRKTAKVASGAGMSERTILWPGSGPKEEERGREDGDIRTTCSPAERDEKGRRDDRVVDKYSTHHTSGDVINKSYDYHTQHEVPHGDVISKSCDYHACREVSCESDDQSDSDSDSWDEELLTSSPFSSDSNTEWGHITYRPLAVLEQSQITFDLSSQAIPNENGLVPVLISKVCIYIQLCIYNVHYV